MIFIGCQIHFFKNDFYPFPGDTIIIMVTGGYFPLVQLGLAKRQARVILPDLVSATGKDLP